MTIVYGEPVLKPAAPSWEEDTAFLGYMKNAYGMKPAVAIAWAKQHIGAKPMSVTVTPIEIVRDENGYDEEE